MPDRPPIARGERERSVGRDGPPADPRGLGPAETARQRPVATARSLASAAGSRGRIRHAGRGLLLALCAAGCVVKQEGLRVDVEIVALGGRLDGATRVLDYPATTWTLRDAWIDVTSVTLVPCASDDDPGEASGDDSGLAAMPFGSLGPLGLLLGAAHAHAPTGPATIDPVRLDLASPTTRHASLRPAPGTYCAVDVRVVPAADHVAWRLSGSVDPDGVPVDLGGPGERLRLDLPAPLTLDADRRTDRLTLALHVDRWLAVAQPAEAAAEPELVDDAVLVERLCEELATAFQVLPP